MSAEVRGTKRRCPHCGAPFYDLNRTPIVCPKCDEEVKLEALRKVPLRSGRGAARVAVAKPVVEEVEDTPALDEDEVLVREDDESEDEEAADDVDVDDVDDELRE